MNEGLVSSEIPLGEVRRFDQLVPGSYQWTAIQTGGGWKANGKILLPAGPATLLSLPLEISDVRLSGQVFLGGELASGGEITVTGTELSTGFSVPASIDENGAYSVSLPRPGVYRLYVQPRARDASGATDGSDRAARTNILNRPYLVEVPGSDSEYTYDLDLPGARLRVEIRGEDGVGVAGARVALERAHDASELTLPQATLSRDRVSVIPTRADGVAQWRGLAPGAYWIQAVAPDGLAATSSNYVVVGDEPELESMVLRPLEVARVALGGDPYAVALAEQLPFDVRLAQGSNRIGVFDRISVWIRPDASVGRYAPWTPAPHVRHGEGTGTVEFAVPAGAVGDALVRVTAQGKSYAAIARWSASNRTGPSSRAELEAAGSARVRAASPAGVPHAFFVWVTCEELGPMPPMENTSRAVYEQILAALPPREYTIRGLTNSGERLDAVHEVVPGEQDALLLTVR
ncbi:MAG: hypothetical protein AAFU73_03420 [Planctomycetota bacterium]